MQDILGMLQSLHRPRLLIRAARFGARDYRRDIHLGRLLGFGTLPRTGPAIMRLIAMEAELDERRRAGDAGYSVARHVEVLAAMMGEARRLEAGE